MTETQAGGATLWTLSLHELEDLKLRDVTWVVDDLLPAGAVALLVGRPKVGKSLLAIDLLACVATGEPFLGRATTAGPALYVPAEDAPSVVRERLRTRLGGESEAPLVVAPADGSLNQNVRISEVGSILALGRTVGTLRPKAVVLDSFRELHGLDENDPVRMAALLKPLRILARASGALVVLTHHRSKRDADGSLNARGSTAITGGVDLVLALGPLRDARGREDEAEEGRAGGTALTLRVEGRYGPRQQLQVKLGPDLRWRPVVLGDSELPVRQRVRHCLEEATEALTAAEVLRACGGARSNVQGALRRLVQAGLLAREGAGTKTDPFRYRVVVPRSPAAAAT